MWSWLVEHGETIRTYFVAVIEIAILWVAFYQLYRAFHATRGANILLGLFSSFIVLALVTGLFKLTVLSWLLRSIFAPGLVVALVVIFQPELRMALAKLGSRRHLAIFGITLWGRQDKSSFIESLCAAVSVLASKRHGALIALQRTNKLHSVVDTGTKVDGLFSKELVGSIFFPKTPLHDGGLIVDQERIVAAGCIFPVSAKEMKDRTIGLRHRAGVGLSEESDAVVVIVSEETGAISLATAGRLERNVDLNYLKTRLKELLYAHVATAQIQEVSQG